MAITYIIIAFTSVISFLAFNDRHLFVKLKHWPYEERRSQEYYRWLTGGLLHANPMHLIFNMLTLYFFGLKVEYWFRETFADLGITLYLVFYLAAIIAASSATYFKYKDSAGFASIGASGAVAAVLFAAILIDPMSQIMFIFLPIPIRAFIFGILYLWYSAYEANRGGDNIDHTAHYYGALFGFFFPMLLAPSLFTGFLDQINAWVHSF
jgi:membrane associated rhomboid family serine protease